MVAADAVFAVPGKRLLRLVSGLPNHSNTPSVFFICFRECLETSIIVSVLLAFLKQTLGPDRDAATYKKLVRQVSLQCTVFCGWILILGIE